MNDIVRMDKLNSLADLTDDTDARFLGEEKVFGDDSVEQFAAVDSATANMTTMIRCGQQWIECIWINIGNGPL